MGSVVIENRLLENELTTACVYKLISLSSEQTTWTQDVNIMRILDYRSTLKLKLVVKYWSSTWLSMSLLENNHCSNHKMVKPIGSQKSAGQIPSPFMVYFDHYEINSILRDPGLLVVGWKNLPEMSLLRILFSLSFQVKPSLSAYQVPPWFVSTISIIRFLVTPHHTPTK